MLANWYGGTKNNEKDPDSSNFIAFKPLDLVFIPGYLTEPLFSIPVNIFAKVLSGWRDKMTFDL